MTGKGISEILPQVFRDAAERMRREREEDFERRLAQLEEISMRAAAKISPNAPSPDEIIGYDENGLPM